MKRVPIDEALKDPQLTSEQKRKLQLVDQARRFAESDLGLAETKNYTSFVQLDRPYVTYVVTAAERLELKSKPWRYPLLGDLPYRGYFNEKDAREEGERLEKEGFDAYVRGVSAYSTLGWFRDPVLSSMLLYEDHDLVNTIIHETTHATLYFKSAADFNERLATFIGNKGTELFYLRVEGKESKTLARIRDESVDDKLFSKFISEEIERIEKWYTDRKGQPIPENERRARLKEIQTRFSKEIRPKMSPTSYANFDKGEINNARLVNYKLYFEDLSDFEKVFAKHNSDFNSFLKFCKDLEKQDKPEDVVAAEAK